MPGYKSYCWSLGTTSFRRKELNKEIEKQLQLLIRFWDLDHNKDKVWDKETQKSYYDFMHDNGFVIGEAPNKCKDSREKTTGLVALGLLNEDRKITNAGKELLEIVENDKFNVENSDNKLRITNDAFIYFKQLLKTSKNISGKIVRPYIIIAKILNKFDELSDSAFWLLPLIIDDSTEEIICNAIEKMKEGSVNLDEVIWGILSSMDNYKEAKELFMSENVTEELIMQIGINRDGSKHDKPYYKLYKSLDNLRNDLNDKTNLLSLYEAVNNISQGCRSYWKKLLFNNNRLTSKSIVSNENILKKDLLLLSSNESSFKEQFFKFLHLFKAKDLLDNYLDLNKRVIKTSKTIIFNDNKVRFDIIPKCFFSNISNQLSTLEFRNIDNLSERTSLKQISPIFDISHEQIFNMVEELYGVKVRNIYEIQDFVDKERYERFNRMIDEKFTDEALIDLMGKFEERNDSEIQSFVTNNADVPTIFEYVLAIAWYKISGRQGKILDYMNLTLDADLLPITHAAGGQGDIEYQYSATENYPAHTLLIEATLANKTNQRRMEMEPVSRHLGDYLLDNKDKEAYCVFATTYLHIQVISDFRARKNMPYYSMDGSESIDGMKIIPFETNELKTIIKKQITYAQLYPLFDKAYNSTLSPKDWYQEEIRNKIWKEN